MIARFFIGLCVAAVILAVILNFVFVNTRAKKEVRSAVATASMALFFAVFALVLRNAIGAFPISDLWRTQVEIAGCILVFMGTVINIYGRLSLKTNWGDHIRIYENHTLITKGIYRYVRHPLYSGLFFIGYGATIVYANWLGAVLMTGIFVPMMIYRSHQEEAALSAVFKEYPEYKKKTRMFIPWPK